LKKTLWPKHWSAQQIMEAIKDAWSDQIYSAEKIAEDKLKLRIIGIANTGLKIEFFVKKLSETQYQLQTAYPYYEKFAGLGL